MDDSVIHQLSITRGVKTLKIPLYIGTENLLNGAIVHAVKEGFLVKGDSIVCLMGKNEDNPDSVNLIQVMTI